MITVGTYEAKTHFAQLLARVAKGERVTVTRHGVPVARIEPVDGPSRKQVRDAIQRLNEIGRGKTLGGITIRELMEEGRRF